MTAPGLSGDLQDGLTRHTRPYWKMGGRNGALLRAAKTSTFTAQDMDGAGADADAGAARTRSISKVQIMVNLSSRSAGKGDRAAVTVLKRMIKAERMERVHKGRHIYGWRGGGAL